MACIGSGRLCARVQEKLCQLGQTAQIKGKAPSYLRNKFGFQPATRNLYQQCQNPDSLTLSTRKIHPASRVPLPRSSSVASATLCGGWHPCSRPDRGNTSTVGPGITHTRSLSTVTTQQPGSLPEYQIDPYRLIEDDLKSVYDEIRMTLRRNTHQEVTNDLVRYYFESQGKAIRPMVAILMARAINYHLYKEESLLTKQKAVAMIAEMMHSASLYHDDVIDGADIRRGKPSANVLWNHKRVVFGGDYIIAAAGILMASLRNDNVTICLTQILSDLVQGEFMQLGSKETENERFAHYLNKTYRKTASLIANSLKAVAIVAGADEKVTDIAFQYGRNLGLAFQLVDDLLDFVSSSEAMGKPAAADLKLGLATAPVLFACEKYPELNPMIMRRFQEPGDVERAFELVHKSQGLEQTQFLARQHCLEASRFANMLTESPFQKALVVSSDLVLNRMK